MNKEIRRSMPLLSIGAVRKLTDLTARQIRYYEEQQLIAPHRTQGNQRLFSLQDIDALLEIKDAFERGVNAAGIRKLLANASDAGELPSLSDVQLRDMMREEMQRAMRFNRPSIRQGDLSRFYQ